MVTTTSITQALDAKDRKIIGLLQRDCKQSQAEIAKQVGLSAAAVNERMKKLENAGVIRRYVAVIDPRSVGASITAFVEVFIEHPRFEPAFIAKARSMDEVQEVHHITGEFSLLLKIRTSGMEALQQLLIHQFNALEGVRQTRTVVALSTSKEESFVSPGGEGEIR